MIGSKTLLKMKRTLSIFAIALGLVACTQEELPQQQEQNQPSLEKSQTMTITASIAESNLTKTALSGNDTDGYDVVWSEGDQIKIGSETFTLTEGAGTTKGKFSGNMLADGSYDAYYATSDGKVPTNQTYSTDKITTLPMHAQVTVTDGKASIANFTNIGGLLHLKVKNIQAAEAKSISLVGSISSSTSSLFLDCSSEAPGIAEEGTDFYIAMPAGSYSGVEITVTAYIMKDNSKKEVTITKKLKNQSLIIEPSKITNAAFTVQFEGKFPTFHNGHEFVDLGLPSGLKWATCNVGANETKDPGSYFAWGETESKGTYTSNNYSYAGTAVPPMANDAANAAWGGNWRMPTKEEVEELIREGKGSNDETEWHLLNNGYRVYGTNGNSIFLPFTGYMYGSELRNNDCGYYWASNGETLPPILQFSKDANMHYSYKCSILYPYYGLAIRPVFK